MQRVRAELLQLHLQPGPDLRVGARELHLVDRRPHVQAGAAHQHGGAAGREQPVDLDPGQPLVLGDAGGLGDVPDVHQMVRDPTPLRRGELGGADVHAPVELHGVGVDHFAVEGTGQGHGQVGLAGGGGADDRDDTGAAGPDCSGAAHRTSLPKNGGRPAGPPFTPVFGHLVPLRTVRA